VKVVAVRNLDARQRHVIEAEGLVAMLTIEMDMLVVVQLVVMAEAQLIADAPAATLDGVYHTVLPEQGERAGDDGLVDGQDSILQVGHRHGTVLGGQCPGNEDPVGSGLDTVGLQQLCIFVSFHLSNYVFLPAKVRIIFEL